MAKGMGFGRIGQSQVGLSDPSKLGYLNTYIISYDPPRIGAYVTLYQMLFVHFMCLGTGDMTNHD